MRASSCCPTALSSTRFREPRPDLRQFGGEAPKPRRPARFARSGRGRAEILAKPSAFNSRPTVVVGEMANVSKSRAPGPCAGASADSVDLPGWPASTSASARLVIGVGFEGALPVIFPSTSPSGRGVEAAAPRMICRPTRRSASINPRWNRDLGQRHQRRLWVASLVLFERGAAVRRVKNRSVKSIGAARRRTSSVHHIESRDRTTWESTNGDRNSARKRHLRRYNGIPKHHFHWRFYLRCC